MENKNSPGAAGNSARGKCSVSEKTILNTTFDWRLKELLIEFYQLGDWTPEAAAYVRHFGLCHQTLLTHSGIFAVCLCIFAYDCSGRLVFRFDPEGLPSAVITVLGCNGVDAIDLVAWPLHSRDEFATAVGGADMLGAWFMTARGGLPLSIYRTPHNWLVGGCVGCVVLNEEWGGHWLHRAGGPFLAEDLQHAREIRTMLGVHAVKHTILVPNREERAA
jgi:hypothetical protein